VAMLKIANHISLR